MAKARCPSVKNGHEWAHHRVKGLGSDAETLPGQRTTPVYRHKYIWPVAETSLREPRGNGCDRTQLQGKVRANIEDKRRECCIQLLTPLDHSVRDTHLAASRQWLTILEQNGWNSCTFHEVKLLTKTVYPTRQTCRQKDNREGSWRSLHPYLVEHHCNSTISMQANP